MISRLFPCVLIMSAMFLAGCVIQPVDSPAVRHAPALNGNIGSTNATDAAVGGESIIAPYKLKPLDPILIRFSGIQEQNSLDVVVDEKGEINLLHIEVPVVAAGMTTSELEEKIERLYIDGGIYKTVSVNVAMTAKAYYVQGEVVAPGKFQLTSGTTLVQAIAEARGPSAFASKKVTITRQGKIYTFNWKELEEDPSKDVKVEAGDVIKIWESWY